MPAPLAASPPADNAATSTGLESTILSVAQGNIAEEKSDIIVNTTTEDMTLDKTAVSKSILEKAGDELQKYCKQYVENGMRLDHGQILITRACGKLRCRKIIHAHLPHLGSMAQSSTDHYRLIEKIVSDCLQRAESEKMVSISFPAFGLGRGGYRVEQVAEPMLKACQAFGQLCPKCVKAIRVVINDSDLYEKFNKFYLQFFGRKSLDCDSTSPLGLLQRFIGSRSKVNCEGQELQGKGVTLGLAPPTGVVSHSVTNYTVVFTIFASSDPQCEKVATILKKLISEKSTNKKISDAHIEQLLDDDFAEITQIGCKLGVQVKIVTKIKEIHISGETSKVFEANHEIKRILSDIERTMANLQKFEWLSEDSEESYEPFPPEASVRLERATNKGINAIELVVEGVAVVIDLQNGIETNKTTGKRRKILRTKKSMQSVGNLFNVNLYGR